MAKIQKYTKEELKAYFKANDDLQKRIEDNPELDKLSAIVGHRRKSVKTTSYPDYYHWAAYAPLSEVLKWAQNIQNRMDADRARVPDHLKYLYCKPNPNNYDVLSDCDCAENILYNGQEPGWGTKPEKFKVAKVTTRFVYVFSDANGIETTRVSREILETDKGVYAKRFFCFVYTWDAIKDECAEFQKDREKWLVETKNRIEAEYMEVAATGFRCARCHKVFESISKPGWQGDTGLAKIDWGWLKTDYDGLWTCKACRTIIFDKHYGESRFMGEL